MSVRAYFDTWCDVCGAWNDADAALTSARESWAAARARGWAIRVVFDPLYGRRRAHLCPSCVKKHDAAAPFSVTRVLDR